MSNGVLNLSQLRSFLVLVEELNFRRAASRLYVTQPALSKQIKTLEEFLETDLFDRTQSEVRLTAAGAGIAADARVLLQGATDLPGKVNRSEADAGDVVVGISMTLEDMVQRAGELHLKRHPAVNLVYRELSSTLQCEALRRREIDVGFVWPPVPVTHLATLPLIKRRLVVVLPKSHPFAARKQIRLSQIATERLILRPRKSGRRLYEPGLALLRKAGIEMRTLTSDLSPQFAADVHVASGEGICILPENIVKPTRNLAVVHILERAAFQTVNIAWRRNEQSPRVLSFVDSARDAFAP